MAVAHEVIDHEHNCLHRGEYWHAVHFNAALANGASDGFVIKTGDREAHVYFSIVSSGSALLRFMEGATVTASDTTTPYNANRYRGGSGTLSLSSASTGTSPDFAPTVNGTMLWEAHIPAIGGFGGGGEMFETIGWLLNRNTTYVLGACNKQGATGGTGFRVSWCAG